MFKLFVALQLYGAFLNEDLLAGTVIFKHQNCWHLQYMGISESGKKVFASDLLYHQIIEEAKAKGTTYLSFGVSQENEGKYTNQSLLEWKESWGAKSIAHEFYEISLR